MGVQWQPMIEGRTSSVYSKIGGVEGFFLGGVQELLIGKGTGTPYRSTGALLGSKRFSGWGDVYPLLLIIPSLLILQSILKK